MRSIAFKIRAFLRCSCPTMAVNGNAENLIDTIKEDFIERLGIVLTRYGNTNCAVLIKV